MFVFLFFTDWPYFLSYIIYIYIYTTCVLLIRFADSRAKLIRFSFLLLCFWFFFFWFYLCVLLPSLFCVVFFFLLIGSTHESRQDINRWTVCNILSNSTWPSLSRANNLTFRVWSAASFLHFLQIYFVFYHFFWNLNELGTINDRIPREEKRMPFLYAISFKISIHNCWSNNRVFIGTAKTSFYFFFYDFYFFKK